MVYSLSSFQSTIILSLILLDVILLIVMALVEKISAGKDIEYMRLLMNIEILV